MIDYIKKGLTDIKDTKRYAREKNVPNWFLSLIGGIMIAFIGSMVLTLYGILFISITNPNQFLLNLFGPTAVSWPFILTFFLMISIGKYLIKSMIYFTYLIQKIMMKGINNLDMYLWKKTGKDSLASNFMVKHKKLIQILFYVPLILSIILRHLPK